MVSLVDRRDRPIGWLRRLGLWLPPLLYMVAIYHLSSESDPLPVLTTHVWDKALHCTEYGGLAFLLSRALLGEGLGWASALALGFVTTIVYGASDEWHQLLTPGRSSDLHDWFADTFGAATGVASAFLLGRFGWLVTRARRPTRS
jgi:VanZ family protein